jgi:hypothetical protein
LVQKCGARHISRIFWYCIFGNASETAERKSFLILGRTFSLAQQTVDAADLQVLKLNSFNFFLGGALGAVEL